jgi:hypothetical protein
MRGYTSVENYNNLENMYIQQKQIIAEALNTLDSVDIQKTDKEKLLEALVPDMF